MILDIHRQVLTVSAIARELGIANRPSVYGYIARGLEPPVYGPRKPRQRLIDPFVPDFARLILPASVNFHWETGAKLLKLLERGLADFYQMRIEIIG